MAFSGTVGAKSSKGSKNPGTNPKMRPSFRRGYTEWDIYGTANAGYVGGYDWFGKIWLNKASDVTEGGSGITLTAGSSTVSVTP